MATLYAVGHPDDPHISKVLSHVRDLGCDAIPVASWSADPSRFHEASWSSASGWTLTADRAFWLRNKHRVGAISSVEKQEEWWSHASTLELFRSAARLGPICFNSSGALAATDNKVAQLAAAAAAGFLTPNTLVSNKKADILAFLEGEGQCIVKPIHSMGVAAINGDMATARFLPTLPITAHDVRNADADAIRVAPNIYQALVPKAHELRTIAFGNETVSFQLDSQSHPYTALDWRAGELLTPCHLVETPSALVEPIRAYLALTGLDTAVFDFAVRPDGQAVFFESNPSGQWERMDALHGDPVSKMFARQMVVRMRTTFASRPPSELRLVR